MNKKVVIAIVIIFVVIIIGVVGYFMYRNAQKRKALEAQQQMDMLQRQLQYNPNMPTAQKGDILGQIAALAAIIAQSRGGAQTPPPQGGGVPPGPLPGLGGAGWQQPTNAPAGFPLAKGSSNNYVKTLQMAINAKCGDKLKTIGMLPLTTDGKFGPLTEKGAAACLGSTSVSWPQFQGLTA